MESNNIDVSSKNKGRRPLHILQPAANDIEALVGADRIIKSACQLKGTKSKLRNTNQTTRKENCRKENSKQKRNGKQKDKAVQTEREGKVQIEVTDLISTDNPSENYWRVMAEKRRVALENTLAENKRLVERVDDLGKNLCVCKELLEESRTFVEVLQEMIEDNGNNLPDDNVP